ncbi:elongin C [Savitreella phatthalungensis]
MADDSASAWVTLTSSDNFSYVVSREACMVSGTLRQMLGSGFSEGRTGKVTLESIEGVLLERVCDYLYFHLRYKDAKEVPKFEVEPEYALNLLVAADFLDV